MICPTSRSPWPARGPLGRLREARQDPGEARTVATIGKNRHAHCALTRVNERLKTLRPADVGGNGETSGIHRADGYGVNRYAIF